MTGAPFTGDPLAGDPVTGETVAADAKAADAKAGDAKAADAAAGEPVAGSPALRGPRTGGGVLAALVLLLCPPAAAQQPDAAAVVARYVEARGGAERWRSLEALELSGTYAAFSFYRPFRLIRKRGDLFRLDYVVLDSPAARARDVEGPWGLDPLIFPAAAHVTEDPYRSQLERESLFGLVLLDAESRGIRVELLGDGEVEGQPTVDLRLTLPGEREEIWHLDPDSWLEVAVDARVWDHTQGIAPMRRRTYFDDFREVDGLVLPFQVDHEFGARLEAMTVEQVQVNPDLDESDFAAPPPKPAEEGAAPPAGADDPGSSERAEDPGSPPGS